MKPANRNCVTLLRITSRKTLPLWRVQCCSMLLVALKTKGIILAFQTHCSFPSSAPKPFPMRVWSRAQKFVNSLRSTPQLFVLVRVLRCAQWSGNFRTERSCGRAWSTSCESTSPQFTIRWWSCCLWSTRTRRRSTLISRLGKCPSRLKRKLRGSCRAYAEAIDVAGLWRHNQNKNNGRVFDGDWLFPWMYC